VIFASQKSSTNLFIANQHLPRASCSQLLANGSCSRPLATCTQVVIARRVENTARQSPYHTLLVIASRAECTARQSHRPQLVRESCHCEPQRGEAISLQVARNPIANRSPHCVRDDNPNLVIAMERSDRSNLIASNTCFWITSLRS
jgi:hypothetical protein